MRWVVVALVALAVGALPGAVAAKACSLTDAEAGGTRPSTLGPTYVIEPSFRVKQTSCKTGKRVITGYGSCGRTPCKQTVRRFKCKQTILGSTPSQYDARVKCRRGSASVKYIYTQNT